MKRTARSRIGEKKSIESNEDATATTSMARQTVNKVSKQDGPTLMDDSSLREIEKDETSK